MATIDKEFEEKHQKGEVQDVKYIRELNEFWDAYMFALINEIYVGIGINLGLTSKEAYRLAKNKPGKLEKADFFSSVFDKFKKVFNYKIPKFRIEKKLYNKGEPLTPKQWDKFNKTIDDYWKKNTEKITEDMAVKGFFLGKETTDYRREKKPYKNKSLYQVEFDQYGGKMPESLSQVYKQYDFKTAEKRALNTSFSNIATEVTKTNNEIKEAIRQQIQTGIDNNKTSVQIASDLYWEVQKNQNLVNKYTSEALRKNWYRISTTETASVYEAGLLSGYIDEAMESLKDPSRAQYFVFTGGSCKWCLAHQGSLVRLVPAEIVTDTTRDSLKSMGIKDPNTDIAVWPGKNNIGFKETKNVHEWRVCTPAHPYNVATLSPINLETQVYNPKTDRVEERQKKEKYIPQQVDYSFKSPQEVEDRKPVYLESGLVRYNNNIYEAVEPQQYKQKKEEWLNNPQLPIPVDKNSTDYKAIFGNAKRV